MNTAHLKKKQQGAALVVSMVILIVLTIMGLTSISVTKSELSMAGNLREQGLTFQAAEAGLKFAEDLVEDNVSKTSYDDSTGLYSSGTADPDYMESETWDNMSLEADTDLTNVTAQPRYIVKYLGDRAQNQGALPNIGGYGGAQPGSVISNFRITSRGSGLTGTSFRYIQSYYGKSF